MSRIEVTTDPDRPPDWPVHPGVMHFRLIDTQRNTESPLLGVLDLSCDNGYVVRSYEFAQPEIRAAVYNNSLDDGTLDVTKFYGSRAVTLELSLKVRPSVNDTGDRIEIPNPGGGPMVPATEARLRDRLRGYLQPYRRARLIFSEHDDERVRQITMRGAESACVIAQPRFNSLSASWVAPRCYIESYALHRATAVVDGVLGESLSIDIVNAGNAPAYWVARIQGEGVSPRFVLSNSVTGSSFLKFNYETQQPGDMVTIDSFTKSVIINRQPIGFGYVDDQSQWFRIPPGVSTLTLDDLAQTRPGWPYAIWTDGQRLPAFVLPQSQQGMFTRRREGEGNPPWVAPPGTDTSADPSLAGFSWSTRPPDSGDPSQGPPGVAQITFEWRDTWV